MKHGSAAYLASLFASQPLVELMRGEDKEDERKKEVMLLEARSWPSLQGVGWRGRMTTPPANLPMGEALVDINFLLGVQLLPELAYSMTQRELSSLVNSESHDRLLQATTSTRELALLRCLERDGAGDWLCPLPSQSLGLHLRKSVFVMEGDTG